MEFHDYISERNILLDMKAHDRWSALEELLDKIYPRGESEHGAILEALRRSEAKKCSAVGRSVTILHVISDKVGELIVGLGMSRKGIPWNAPDGRVVSIIWMMVHPESEQGTYLTLLAQAMRLCRDSGCRGRLMEAESSSEVKAIIGEAGARLCPAGS